MATTYSLNIEPRQRTGKGGARAVRRDDAIPGILYGKGADPLAIKVDRREFLRTIGGHSVSNMVLDLAVDGGTSTKALIREIQLDPVSNEVLHVDFNTISATKRIEIEVPLETVGVPDGVKNYGGLLSLPRRLLTVLCLPSDVPDKIEVDVSELGLNEALHVSDLDVPGVEIVTEGHFTVAAVVAPKAAEEPETEEAEEGEAAEGEAAEGEAKAEGEDGDEDKDKDKDKNKKEDRDK